MKEKFRFQKNNQYVRSIDDLTENKQDIFNENRFPYLMSKAFSLIEEGTEKYRKSDAFNMTNGNSISRLFESLPVVLTNPCKALHPTDKIDRYKKSFILSLNNVLKINFLLDNFE